MKHRLIFLATLILTVLLFSSSLVQAAPNPARPQARTQLVGAMDVFSAVNALRKSQGLAPYEWDGGIAAYSQDHSDYQAKIDQWTHTHSDGSSAGSRGYNENIATGTPSFLNAQNIVYEIWADAIHMKTMLGYASGSAGVGVASNGSNVFVTLNVLPGNAVAAPTLPGGTPGVGFVYTPIALVPLTTTTPRASGALVHEVGYGQSLWAIAMAYQVPGVRIRELNGMAPDQNDIYAGQRLLIVPAGTLTPPAAVTEAPAETGATAQPTASRTPTRFPTRTPLPSAAASPTPAAAAKGIGSIIRIDPVLAGLIGMACLGLGLFLVSGVKIRRNV